MAAQLLTVQLNEEKKTKRFTAYHTENKNVEKNLSAKTLGCYYAKQ